MDTKTTMTEGGLLRMAVDIVSAYVGRNEVSAHKLPDVIVTVYDALSGLQTPAGEAAARARQPAVTVSRSIKRKSIVCLEDGKAFKALKRHLRTAHDLTPDEYRSKWGLQNSYPMVAPDYSAKRSALAKKMRLGQKAGRQGAAAGNVTEAA